MIRVAWGWERPKLCTGRRWVGLIWNIRDWWASFERAIRLANILVGIRLSGFVRKMGENLRGTIAIISYHAFIRWRCLSYNSIIQSHPAVPDGQNRELTIRDSETSCHVRNWGLVGTPIPEENSEKGQKLNSCVYPDWVEKREKLVVI